MEISPVDAVPYSWPWHGEPEGSRLALVVLRDPSWSGADPAPAARLLRLADAVTAAGGLIVVAIPAGTTSTAPVADVLVETHAVSAFHGTSLDDVLRRAGRTDLIVAGWGLEGPVHSTLREANDQGYECLLVPDACSSVDPVLAEAAASMVMHSGGIFGAYAPTADVLAAFGAANDPNVPRFEEELTAMTDTTAGRVDAEPYAWPYDGELDPRGRRSS